MAGVALHSHIIELTATDGRDQSHLSVVHISRSELIPDRTEFLLGHDHRNPGPIMADIVAEAVSAAGSGDESATGTAARDYVVGVPCNTFHAPSIIGPFLARLRESAPNAVFVDMIAATIARLRWVLGASDAPPSVSAATGDAKPATSDAESRASAPGAVTVGLMSTTGTRRTGVWRDALSGAGFSVVEVPEARQDELHAAIYDRGYGLKAVSPPSERARRRVEGFARDLLKTGASILVPACTELPLVLPDGAFDGALVVDPVRALAANLVVAAGGELRGVSETVLQKDRDYSD